MRPIEVAARNLRVAKLWMNRNNCVAILVRVRPIASLQQRNPMMTTSSLLAPFLQSNARTRVKRSRIALDSETGIAGPRTAWEPRITLRAMHDAAMEEKAHGSDQSGSSLVALVHSWSSLVDGRLSSRWHVSLAKAVTEQDARARTAEDTDDACRTYAS